MYDIIINQAYESCSSIVLSWSFVDKEINHLLLLFQVRKGHGRTNSGVGGSKCFYYYCFVSSYLSLLLFFCLVWCVSFHFYFVCFPFFFTAGCFIYIFYWYWLLWMIKITIIPTPALPFLCYIYHGLKTLFTTFLKRCSYCTHFHVANSFVEEKYIYFFSALFLLFLYNYWHIYFRLFIFILCLSLTRY